MLKKQPASNLDFICQVRKYALLFIHSNKFQKEKKSESEKKFFFFSGDPRVDCIECKNSKAFEFSSNAPQLTQKCLPNVSEIG